MTKIYNRYTFKQARFKQDFVVMSQNARKVANTKVEKDFYKLLNNSNLAMIVEMLLEIVSSN